MLSWLPLPFIWLLFYAVGRVSQGRSLGFRQYLAAGISLVLLTVATRVDTVAFYTAIALAIILVGQWLKQAQEGRRRRVLLVAAIVAVAAGVAVFLKWRILFQKYFVHLPSLSYLGFRGIAYLVSCHRRGGATFPAALNQMLFFPALFVGPITRVENYQEERQDYWDVLKRLFLGFTLLIAGHLAGEWVLEDILWRRAIPCWRYWVGIFANSFELYFTFAGYTHLVIGLGLLAGFKLPENFNLPYFSPSISEFWRRWHMSLSYWVRDYIYIPLGGNRKGIWRKCANLLIAMLVMGAWHGLSWHYMIWGLCHGALLCVESLLAYHDWRPAQRLFRKAAQYVKVALTFSLVSLLWLLFTYSVPEFVAYLGRLIP